MAHQRVKMAMVGDTVTEVSIEHMPVTLAPSGNIDDAPRDFTIWVSYLLPVSINFSVYWEL